MCMMILPACISVYCVGAVPMEDRRKCRIPWDWSFRWLAPPCGCWDPTAGMRKALMMVSGNAKPLRKGTS